MANSLIAPSLKTPGVYIEEISVFPPSVAQVPTAIPAFIGHTQFAKDLKDDDLLNKPRRISSMVDYKRYFGGPDKEKNIVVNLKDDAAGNIASISLTFGEDSSTTDNSNPPVPTVVRRRSPHNMFYALQAFFANGGGVCYIVSVGQYVAPEAPTATATEKNHNYSAVDSVKLIAGLEEIAKIDEVTLIVFPEEQKVSDKDKYAALHQAAVKQCFELQDRFTIMSLYQNTMDINADQTAFRNLSHDLNQVHYAAAYYPNLETVFEFSYEDADVKISHATASTPPVAGGYDGRTLADLKTGIAAVVAVPTSTPPVAAVAAVKPNGAAYAKAKNDIGNISYVLPPSAVMAGIYASVDSSRGVWKSPANAAVKAVKQPVIVISDKDQADLNIDVNAGKSINAIRSFVGRGVIVWGARTLAGNSNEWRYISVRRFFNMVEESSKKATFQFVFEPNDKNTWVRVKAMIDNFLILQWRAGALAGAAPDQAFYVKVGLGETMTAIDILEGRMIVEIGMAVVRPAEFIILQFMHKMQES